MVIVILKDDYIVSFEMASFEKEKALVEKFTSGKLGTNVKLDLRSKGEIMVSDIKAMEFSPTKVLRKKND